MSSKQIIVMRKDLNMRKGKMIAQGSHASLGIFTQKMTKVGDNPDGSADYAIVLGKDMKAWIDSKFTKICLSCDSEEELLELYEKAKKAGIDTVLITDSGLTEFNGVPTNTCIAIGPADELDIDIITGHLKLL